MATLKITQVRSRIGATKNQRRNLDALGLTRINKSVEHEDSAIIKGMLTKVFHLVKVETVEGAAKKKVEKKVAAPAPAAVEAKAEVVAEQPKAKKAAPKAAAKAAPKAAAAEKKPAAKKAAAPKATVKKTTKKEE